MKKAILILILLSFVKLNAKDFDKEKQNLLLISNLKRYELDEHIKFQKVLKEKSNYYFKRQSKEFVDEETGFITLWSEVFHYFESDVKKDARWRLRIEKYFRTTAYQSYLLDEIKSYAETVNSQREELLGTFNKNKHQNNLIIPLQQPNEIKLNSDKLDSVINKIQKMVLTEVITQIADLLSPVLIGLLFTFFIGGGVVLGIKTQGLTTVVTTIIIIIYSIFSSINLSNLIEDDLNVGFSKFNDKQLEILPILDNNTVEYFSVLTNELK